MPTDAIARALLAARTQDSLPPLPEQRRIAAILDKADAIRRKRQEAIRLTDQFLRSAFLEMFGDPASNRKGFPRVKLSDLAAADGIKCGPFGTQLSKSEYRSAGVPLWGIKHVNVHFACPPMNSSMPPRRDCWINTRWNPATS